MRPLTANQLALLTAIYMRHEPTKMPAGVERSLRSRGLVDSKGRLTEDGVAALTQPRRDGVLPFAINSSVVEIKCLAR